MEAMIGMGFAVVLFLCAAGFLLGLISPRRALWWSHNKKDRKNALPFYFIGMLFAFLSAGTLAKAFPWWMWIVVVVIALLWLGFWSELRGHELKKTPPVVQDQQNAQSVPLDSSRKKNLKKGYLKAQKNEYSSLGNDASWSMWAGVHDEDGQTTRQKRAWGCYMDSIDYKRREAKMHGNRGEVYTTTLEKCTCYDFRKRRIPCKHMYRLAMELGLVKLPIFDGDDEDYTLE